jgi:hypothetical protein
MEVGQGQNWGCNAKEKKFQKTANDLSYNIYLKPTTTDTILNNILCNPIQHKMSAINYLINRFNTCVMEKDNKIIL